MNLRRRILSAQKYGGWTQPSRRKATRRARKEEGRALAVDLDRGLDDYQDGRYDDYDWPYPGDRVVWSEIVPGFTWNYTHAAFAEELGRHPFYGRSE